MLEQTPDCWNSSPKHPDVTGEAHKVAKGREGARNVSFQSTATGRHLAWKAPTKALVHHINHINNRLESS